ncbi:XXYS1_4_G0042980.mRNA.1.CDS.1 [Saccharomyces cerevisiae]|nr:EM14S01-3B_G0040460.mRNA.1.CDS.1 [Saccharomyces cerevisiae]CAD6637883.1 XXYS1_4_G0042980.mRNA.1.CDS.1 [Saccharomyces cerevisiae]CAI4710184.1 AMH_1a_G0038710.mRNA.1.CDS.1 [Saccharomyces cerevisiae]CAI4710372.1 CEI_1a_G0038580.mRNA.1.CDS.1 [Saccharomyces cerevisiae]CAI6848370.1 AMH_1a_G0038710.mRNA.1.CDS.1 [Saccharomyces cerevisiae]
MAYATPPPQQQQQRFDITPQSNHTLIFSPIRTSSMQTPSSSDCHPPTIAMSSSSIEIQDRPSSFGKFSLSIGHNGKAEILGPINVLPTDALKTEKSVPKKKLGSSERVEKSRILTLLKKMRNRSSTVNKKYSKVPLKSTASLQPSANAFSPMTSNTMKISPNKLASPRTPIANSNLNLNFTPFQIKTGFTPNIDGILLENFTSPNSMADSQNNSASNTLNTNHGSATNANQFIFSIPLQSSPRQFRSPARLIDPLPISEWNTSLLLSPPRTANFESTNNHLNSNFAQASMLRRPSLPHIDEVIPQNSNPTNYSDRSEYLSVDQNANNHNGVLSEQAYNNMMKSSMISLPIEKDDATRALRKLVSRE